MGRERVQGPGKFKSSSCLATYLIISYQLMGLTVGVKTRAFHKPGKCPTTELQPQPLATNLKIEYHHL